MIDAPPGAPPRNPAAIQTASPQKSAWLRWLLLALLLVAWLRVTWRLDAKNLWWDESLSLQRAEQGLAPLLRGDLVIKDGLSQIVTTDQHPFFSFLLQGILIRLAGDDEFVLRFVSAAAATVMVAAMWVFGRAFVRRGVLAPSAPLWMVLLTALHPFLLWYGQEARPYALWALLTVLSTYLLLISIEPEHPLRWRRVGYAITLAMALCTHFYAVFLLPVQAVILYRGLAVHNRRRAVAAVIVFFVIAALIAGMVGWYILGSGGGGNFSIISLRVLLPDLLNAYSLGLSVDIDQVWWLDLLFAGVAALGAIWSVRSRAVLRNDGWVPLALLLTPIAALLVINSVQGVYMNARHLSLLVGPFIFLLGAGLAVVGLWKRWLAPVLALFMLAGFAFSTVNYHTREEYAKDDFGRLGSYMQDRIMPGDVVLVYPAASWRIFDYYAPLAAPLAAMAQGEPVAVYRMPLVNRSMEETTAFMEELGQKWQRVWLLKSGTMPYADLDGQVEQWLRDHFLLVRDAKYFSHSSLRSQLYLPRIPVFDSLPEDVQQRTEVEFGDVVRLAGYELQQPVAGLPLPVALYWQVNEKPTRRYKTILQLMERSADGQLRVLGGVEREPYEGDIPTIYWDPGKTILEYIELPIGEQPTSVDLYLALTMYDAETLEKLPVTQSGDAQTTDDNLTVLLPVTLKPGAAHNQP